MKVANAESCEQVDRHSGEYLSFEDWCEKRKVDSLQFQFWDVVWAMELVILSLIWAFREANYTLYYQALAAGLPP